MNPLCRKRLWDEFSNDPEYRENRCKFEEEISGLSPLLSFNSEEKLLNQFKYPVAIEIKHQIAENFDSAITDYFTNHHTIEFKEDYSRTVNWLQEHGLKAVGKTDNLFNNTNLHNTNNICRILNHETKNPISITSSTSNKKIVPAKNLFLYSVAHIYKCTIVVFSTRHAPIIVTPFDHDN